MEFTPIDLANWKRREMFLHFTKAVPCTYSLTKEIDITGLRPWCRRSGVRFTPLLLYTLTKLVNRHEEFRTARINGVLGVFSDMNPSYTIFHKETETFSSLWTEYSDDFSIFTANYRADQEKYGNGTEYQPKGAAPLNLFDVSVIPWTDFSAFHLDIGGDKDYYLPIFTIGKSVQRGEREMLPVAAQVHHAVCDGFHTARFLNELEELLRI